MLNSSTQSIFSTSGKTTSTVILTFTLLTFDLIVIKVSPKSIQFTKPFSSTFRTDLSADEKVTSCDASSGSTLYSNWYVVPIINSNEVSVLIFTGVGSSSTFTYKKDSEGKITNQVDKQIWNIF